MPRPTRVAFVSLGCAKNLVDSEKMLGQLAESGCELTNDGDDADTIVINTCGFLEAARIEAHEAIAEAILHKKTGRCKRVVVAGCLVQRDGWQLLRDVPGIDALVGVNNRNDVPLAVLNSTPGRKSHKEPALYLDDCHGQAGDDTGRLRLTSRHYAYLRISEGCDQKCTFCTIPSIRGPMRCKPVGRILREADELVADGAVEINLIGQDTTSYGKDIGYEPGLTGLLHQLNRVDGLRWLRLMYAYPTDFSDEMIHAIVECEKVVNYIDLPLQHINDRILKAMHRRITKTGTIKLLENIRRIIPDVAIRTTLIAGFPGETDKEFKELLAFIDDFKFDALGVFPFSAESETPAGKMHDPLSQVEKEERVNQLMSHQQEIAFDLTKRRIGQTFDVLVEGHPENDAQPARHAGQAPEVDSLTYVTDGEFEPGAFVRVRCTAARQYDLIAQPADVILPQ